MSHQATLDAALADKVETKCAETVKAGRMFRSLHKKDADVVVEGEKKVEPSSPVPTPLPATTASVIIQQVCAKPSQHDQNDYVMDEMSTRGACMYECGLVFQVGRSAEECRGKGCDDSSVNAKATTKVFRRVGAFRHVSCLIRDT